MSTEDRGELVDFLLRAATVFVVLCVAGLAAVQSYTHMYDVSFGFEPVDRKWRANIFPLSVDGLAAAATLVLVTRRRAKLPGGWIPWSILTAGVAVSVVVNIMGAADDAGARFIAAWPALAFPLAVHLLTVQRKASQPAVVEIEARLPELPEFVEPLVAPASAPIPPPARPVRQSWEPAVDWVPLSERVASAGSAVGRVTDREPAVVDDLVVDAAAVAVEEVAPVAAEEPVADVVLGVSGDNGSEAPTDNQVITLRQLLDEARLDGAREPSIRKVMELFDVTNYRAKVLLTQARAGDPVLNGASGSSGAGSRSVGR